MKEEHTHIQANLLFTTVYTRKEESHKTNLLSVCYFFVFYKNIAPFTITLSRQHKYILSTLLFTGENERVSLSSDQFVHSNEHSQ